MKSFLKTTSIVLNICFHNTKSIYWSVLTVLVAMTLSGCKDESVTDNPFPVNESFAMQLISKGIPADIAQFFAAARMETKKPNDTTCIYLQTFPNGATREITLRVSPNSKYTPTPAEIASTAPGSIPIYGFKYSSSDQVDGTTRIDMKYYVAKTSITKGAEFSQIAQGTNASDYMGISWGEIGRKGADVGIGSMIDWAKDNGVRVGPLGSIFTIASALSDLAGALDVSRQNLGWFAELDALEKCAANPTSQVARSDPNYSAATVARIQAARSELQQVGAVRFLNIMTETGSGINPVTAALSVGLKQGFVWSEQTLNNYSENTIMREARLMVVPCDNSGELAGNVDALWDCTITYPDGTDHEVWHTTASVKWVFDPTQMQYISQGSYTFEYTRTTTGGGKTCTDKKTSMGSIAGTGKLMVWDDPAVQQILGYGYIAGGGVYTQVAASYSCTAYSTMEPYTIQWLPPISGYRGTGGSFEGEMTKPSCIVFGASYTGTLKVKWSFSVPPVK